MKPDKTEAGTQGLMQLLRPHRPNKQQFAVMGALVLITALLELVIPLYSRHMIDSISQSGFALTLVATLIGIVLLTALFEGVLAWYGSFLGESTNKRLRLSLFSHLLNTQQAVLNKEHSAELSARVVNDSMSIKSILAEDLIGFISGLVSIVSVVAIMFYLDWRLTLVLVSCIVLGMLLITPLALSMRGIGMAMQEAEAKLIANVTEWLRSAKTIKVHNASSQVLSNGQILLEDTYRHAMRQARVMALIGPISNLILMVSMIAILAASAKWLADGSLTLGTVTAFLIYLFGLAFPIMAMGMFLSNLHRASGAAQRMQKILDFAQEQTGDGEALTTIHSIEVRDLSYTVDDKMILNRVSWDFTPSRLTVIVGESGSGKSSLVQQLVGLYCQTLDRVTINQKPLRQYCLKDVRSKIAWLEQHPSIFIGTVRDNLCIGLKHLPCEAELLNALDKVGLSEWFTRQGADLDLFLNEQLAMSGGERQRLALARAILREPQLLILDEPTSALDKESEQELMRLIRALSQSVRVIMVTHNRHLIEPGDDVLCIQDGQVAIDAFTSQVTANQKSVTADHDSLT